MLPTCAGVVSIAATEFCSQEDTNVCRKHARNFLVPTLAPGLDDPLFFWSAGLGDGPANDVAADPAGRIAVAASAFDTGEFGAADGRATGCADCGCTFFQCRDH